MDPALPILQEVNHCGSKALTMMVVSNLRHVSEITPLSLPSSPMRCFVQDDAEILPGTINTCARCLLKSTTESDNKVTSLLLV